MSARGSLALGSKLHAESKRLIPVSWLALLSPEDAESIIEHGSAIIPRKQAIENFDNNAPFLSEITAGNLDFGVSEDLITPARSSRARTVTINIAELVDDDEAERELPGISTVIDAIARKDANLSFKLPARSIVNPATGDTIKVKPINLKSTADIMYSVCWITDRRLEIADKEELESMVTGHIWG